MTAQPRLARQLGLFDATMIVMGGIIGSGIFMNPAVVAQQDPNISFTVLAKRVINNLISSNPQKTIRK